MTTARTITVGVDGSEKSVPALTWAAREAVKRSARLRVVHAYTIPYIGGDFGTGAAYATIDLEALHGAHESVMADQISDVRKLHPELDIDTVVDSGPIVATIVDNSEDAELVVIGTQGAGSMIALFLGSVAHGVAHRAPCPVVLIPNIPIGTDVERIVVGTDGSPSADAAVDWAVAEAGRWGADLTVVHAWDYPYLGPRTGTAEPSELMELDAARELADSVAALRARRPAMTTTVHAKLAKGATADALIAAVPDCDLLVVGARGRGAFKSALLGSISSAVIHRATCPVAIIHAPAH